MHISQLLTNADGKLSRTQISLWLVHLTTMVLIAFEAGFKDVLTTPLIGVLLGWHVSCHIDRMDARRIDLRISKDGAALSLASQAQSNPAVPAPARRPDEEWA